jgi:hypothetical protein
VPVVGDGPDTPFTTTSDRRFSQEPSDLLRRLHDAARKGRDAAEAGSEVELQLATLAKERALYRLVLGMPDQADLLELIEAREMWDDETVRRACLDLSATSQL